MPGKNNVVTTGISLPRDLMRRLDDMARVTGVSRSRAIVMLLGDALDDAERGVKFMSSPKLVQALGKAFMVALDQVREVPYWRRKDSP